MRQNYEREIREDNDRLRQREEQVFRSQRVLEEARVAESKLATDRELERRKQEDELAKDRSGMTEKVQRLSALEARLNVQKEELERRETSLNTLEKRLEVKSENLTRQEAEVKVAEEVTECKKIYLFTNCVKQILENGGSCKARGYSQLVYVNFKVSAFDFVTVFTVQRTSDVFHAS